MLGFLKKAVLWMCVLMPAAAFAQTDLENMSMQDLESKILSGELSQMMQAVESELYNVLPESDELVDYYKDIIRMTPSYMMEYVGTMLNRMPGVPEQILALPEIKKWKGKYPTRIAPEMQAYAKKYIRDMSPHLYYLLAPETFGRRPEGTSREAAEYKSLYEDYVFVIDESKPPFFKEGKRERSRLGHPDLVPKALFQTGPDAPKPPPVKELFPREKMLRFIKAANAWANFVVQDESLMQNMHRRMEAMTYNLKPEDVVSPCAVQARNIELLGYEKVFDDVLRMEGFKRDEFVAMCDKLVKAYRVGNLTLEKAFWVENRSGNVSFNEWRSRTRLKNADEYLKMYDATDEEAMAVEPYKKDLYDLFEKKHLMIYLDLPFGGYET